MLIVVLITIGFITLMTLLTYTLEQRIRNHQQPRFTFLAHALEAASVLISMILLRQIFTVLNSGDVISWAYATAQLTILLFSLNTMRNLAVEVINILMPIFIYGQSIWLGQGPHQLPVFITMTIILGVIVIYIARNYKHIVNSQWQYLALQVLYAGTWWGVIWSVHRFNLIYTINVVLIFIVYMWLIRLSVQRIQKFFTEALTFDQQVNYDELTGVRNRASFDATTQQIFKAYQERHTGPITMAMLDIDHFKHFNDQYGHLAGDAVLRHVAHFFELELKRRSTHGQLFRYGGEEFIFIFRGTTAASAGQLLKALQDDLRRSPVIFNDQTLTVTVSIGISALKTSDDSFTEWFVRVDDYLYQSKQGGRDRITVEGDLLPR